MTKFKIYLAIILTLFLWSSGIAQNQFKKVNLELYYEDNDPIIGANIIIEKSNPIIGTNSDLMGKAKLNFTNWNETILISYLGPTDIRFKILKDSDLIIVNLKKKRITFYSQNRKIRKIKIKTIN